MNKKIHGLNSGVFLRASFHHLWLSLLLTIFTSFPTLSSADDLQPLLVSSGTAKLSGLFQTWALNDTTAAHNAGFNFRIRRAEIHLSGSLSPQTRWLIMVDPAKSIKPGPIESSNDNKILQDLILGFEVSPHLDLQIGQFKIPTVYEGFSSSKDLLFPERSFISRTYGDRRETGFMATATYKPIVFKLMVSNGQVTPGATGTNIDDTNSSKDVHGRLDYTLSEHWKLGSFISHSLSTAGLGTRYGLNGQWSLEKILLRLEALTARELHLNKNGMMMDFAYKINDDWQTALRYENFQQTSSPKSSSSAYTLGLNYYLTKYNSKLQLAYTLLRGMVGNNGSYKPAQNPEDSSLIIFNVQMNI